MKTTEEKKQYFHDYYEKNKARISVRQSAYYEKNKETIHTQHKEYDNSHKKEIAKSKKEYAKEHREEIASYHHNYYLADPEKFKQRAKNQRAKDPAAARAYDTRYYAEHPERYREYRHENAEAIRLNNQKRRALQLTNTPKEELLTLEQWRDIEEQFDYSCAYCGRKMERLTIDHITPLSQRGMHSKENIVPACRSCNSSKRERTLLQWMLSRRAVSV